MVAPMQATDTKTVISTLGGPQAVADLTGRNRDAVYQWVRFTAFPSDTYLVMSRALQERGIAAPPSLWGMVEP